MTTLPIFAPGEPNPSGSSSSYRWATVVEANPIRIRLDGDSDPLPFSPDTLVSPEALSEGNRVWVQLWGRRVIVLGVGGGDEPAFDPGWIAPTFTNGWTDYGSSWPAAGYRFGRDGKIHLKGLVKDGTGGINFPMFTLPVGYRPEGTSTTGELFLQAAQVSGGQGYCRLDVLGDGRVSIIAYGPSASNGFVSLAGISFYPAGA